MGSLNVGEPKIGDNHEELQAPSVCEQEKEETMADNRLQDASWEPVNSTRDANQAIANTIVTVLDRNAKIAQTTFLSAIEVLERETDDMRHLAQEWGRQIQKQQDAFQRLADGTMETYMSFLRAWFSFNQRVWGVTRSAVDRELQLAQDAAQRAQKYSQ